MCCVSLQGAAEGSEQASRGKVVLLKKKVEELEQQLKQADTELQDKVCLKHFPSDSSPYPHLTIAPPSDSSPSPLPNRRSSL